MHSIKQRFLVDKTTKSEINEKPKGKSSRQKTPRECPESKKATNFFTSLLTSLFAFRHPKKFITCFYTFSHRYIFQHALIIYKTFSLDSTLTFSVKQRLSQKNNRACRPLTVMTGCLSKEQGVNHTL